MSNTFVLYVAINGERNGVLRSQLGATGIILEEVLSFSEATAHLTEKATSVCILRSEKPSDQIHEAMRHIKRVAPNTKVILSFLSGTIEEAVQFIKAGASDFLIGDIGDPRLTESVLRTVPDDLSITSPPFNHESKNNSNGAGVFIGQSSAICEIRSAVNLVAKSETTVLITGESGTGKEVVAHLLHQQSNRSSKPFIPLNCAALPKDVLENELFGHERGAFTGALVKKIGCFEMANTGTLLFDEVAEMSLDTQAKLLRAIETQKFRRLGGKEEVHVDVRMIAATNKNIAHALKSRELREDLYYRLSVIEIHLPPLRERKEDIPVLVDHFLASFASKYNKPLQKFSDAGLELLIRYPWPGNVREIRNVVERAVVICQNESIGPKYLPERITRGVTTTPQINIPVGSSTQEAERILILQTLASAGNNKAKAAKILGVSRKTLHNKLASFSQSE